MKVDSDDQTQWHQSEENFAPNRYCGQFDHLVFPWQKKEDFQTKGERKCKS